MNRVSGDAIYVVLLGSLDKRQTLHVLSKKHGSCKDIIAHGQRIRAYADASLETEDHIDNDT
jgi:hypothetical protein